jgi:hypothetical protein
MTANNDGQKTDREEIERRIVNLRLVENVRLLALPVAAASAAVGIAFPVVFGVGAGIAALALGAGEFFARGQRKILDEEIERFKTRYGAEGAEITKLSSSANTLTVTGPSG